MPGVDGRVEVVDEGQPYAVIVDYAHTPDGFENVLRTVNEFAEGRVLTVFGCGGDRIGPNGRSWVKLLRNIVILYW